MPAESNPIRFPDFLCIGAQKAGTTWLYENLRMHPDVWLPPVKELQYFNHLYVPGHRNWTDQHRRRQSLAWIKGITTRKGFGDKDMSELTLATLIYNSEISDEWYGRVFSNAPDNRICGEITPEYSLLPRAGVAHVRKINPNARIIFFMRDPIDRALSHLRMLKSQHADFTYEKGLTFGDVAMRSDYPTIIADWSRAVGKERLLLAYLDDIESQPMSVLQSVCKFLGIDSDTSRFPRAEEIVFKGPEDQVPAGIYEELKRRLRPVYDRLEEVIEAHVAQKWIGLHY